jgi:hypothetical protein
VPLDAPIAKSKVDAKKNPTRKLFRSIFFILSGSWKSQSKVKIKDHVFLSATIAKNIPLFCASASKFSL